MTLNAVSFRGLTHSPVHVVPRCPGEIGLRDRSSCSRCARSSSLVVRAMQEPRKLPPLPLLPPWPPAQGEMLACNTWSFVNASL